MPRELTGLRYRGKDSDIRAQYPLSFEGELEENSFEYEQNEEAVHAPSITDHPHYNAPPRAAGRGSSDLTDSVASMAMPVLLFSAQVGGAAAMSSSSTAMNYTGTAMNSTANATSSATGPYKEDLEDGILELVATVGPLCIFGCARLLFGPDHYPVAAPPVPNLVGTRIEVRVVDGRRVVDVTDVSGHKRTIPDIPPPPSEPPTPEPKDVPPPPDEPYTPEPGAPTPEPGEGISETNALEITIDISPEGSSIGGSLEHSIHSATSADEKETVKPWRL